MKTTCLIIDDEPLAINVIKNHLKQFNDIELVNTFNNAIDALSFLNDNCVDLIFLDINMPLLDGLNFIKTLENKPQIIITTAHTEFAVDSYELDVLDYLVKPIPFGRFLKAINRAKTIFESKQSMEKLPQPKEEFELKSDFIFIKADKKTHRLSFKDIIYIEALGDYIKIYTEQTSIVTYMSLKKMEAILPSTLFPRVHKSYIISLEKIISIEGNMVEIANEKITIGSSYRKNFFNLIKSHSA